jgi:hypothetical protein
MVSGTYGYDEVRIVRGPGFGDRGDLNSSRRSAETLAGVAANETAGTLATRGIREQAATTRPAPAAYTARRWS